MNKRGQEAQEVFFAIEIMLGMLVAAIFLVGTSNFDAFSELNKNYAQQDVPLLAESLDASPGEVTYYYTAKGSLDVELGEVVKVTRSGNIIKSYQEQTVTFSKNPSSRSIEVDYA